MLGLWDSLIALQDVNVAAESLGLGTCYNGSIQEFDIREHYRERESVWERVSEERKAQLRGDGIHNIPQALAKQRFSDEITRERSRGIMVNLRRAGFEFE